MEQLELFPELINTPKEGESHGLEERTDEVQ
jgi:hypothetical protein